MMAPHRRMLPSAFGTARRRSGGLRRSSDAEQRAEGVEQVEPAIEAERELIEVGLQVLRLDAPVMRALEPRLEVRKHEGRTIGRYSSATAGSFASTTGR